MNTAINTNKRNTTEFWKIPGKERMGGGNKPAFDIRLGLSKKNTAPRLNITYGRNLHALLDPFTRVRVSSLEVIGDRIYFGFYEDHTQGGTYCISRSKKSKGPNPKTQLTLTEAEKNIFNERWKEGYYKLQYDKDLRLHYVSCKEED